MRNRRNKKNKTRNKNKTVFGIMTAVIGTGIIEVMKNTKIILPMPDYSQDKDLDNPNNPRSEH